MPKPDDRSPDFSNVRSGSSSRSAKDTPGRDGSTAYTVVRGDTLSAIARRHYGDASKWQAIYDANRDLITNPDLIHPGWVLKLPQL